MTKRELSVFVDESGSFDSSIVPSRFYLVSFVFHDQREDIKPLLKELETQLSYIGCPDICIHTGPLIRREGTFIQMNLLLRRKLFGRILAFARSAPVWYHTFCIDKRYCNTPIAMEAAIVNQITGYLSSISGRISGYERLKIYYDNGQAQISSILKRTFATFPATFVPNVTPARYRLFQVADLACTTELLRAKIEADIPLTKSENFFFNGVRELKKNYIRPLARIRL